MNTSFADATLQEVGLALLPLASALHNDTRRNRLLASIGYSPNTLEAAALTTLVAKLQADYFALQTALTTPAASLTDLKSQLNSFLMLLQAVDDLKALFAQANSANGALDLVGDLTTVLFGDYLKNWHPRFYTFLLLVGLVEDPASQEPTPPVIDNGVLVRDGYQPYRIHLDKLSALLSDPATYFKNEYYPQGLATRAIADAVADKLFPRLAIFLGSLGFEITYGLGDHALDYGSVGEQLMQHMLSVQLGNTADGIGRFGVILSLSSAEDGNFGLVVSPFGILNYQTDLASWLVDIVLTASIQGFSIGPTGAQLSGTSSATSFGATASVTSQPDDSGNAFLFGAPNGTHLAIGEVAFKAGLQVVNGQAEYGLMAQATKAKFVLRAEESDGFLGAIIPAEGVAGAFDLGLGWSKSKGFYLLGSAALKATYATNGTKIDRVLSINSVTVGLSADTQRVLLSATASGHVKLGPIQTDLTEIGAQAVITFPGSGGNIGALNAEVEFKFPAGVGIQVDSDLVTGGGYLYFDAPNHKYSGAANLLLNKKINLNALGLLQTQLPGNPDAYSLLLLITATFAPIELGLGFTLNGLGGLLGVNRAANTSYLRGLLSRGELDKLLFPANVLDNPAAALATVDAAFPATEGRYIIGLLGELGWGVPTSLITLDVALLMELPAPVRLLILGVLKASLPSKTNELLKLRADFLGSIDFGAKKVAFDSVLSDSRLLAFSLSGDIAFRLYQGSNPVFLITAGGFHPSFQPPAGADLPTLRRLTLALAQGDDLRISLASYFALTSNTVQFGSHLDLYLRLRLGLYVEGHFGFDVLFQFNPFRLLAHVEAGVAIKRGNSDLLSLHLSLDVTGPGPWHVWGEASFRIWFVRIGVSVDKTIGDPAPSPALPAPNVHDPLLAALNDAANWTVETPTTAVPGGVVLRAASTPAGQFFLDPRGTIVVSQRVAPLGITLDKYGNGPAAPTGGNRFELLGLRVGNTLYLLNDATSSVQVTSVTDFFAPERFSKLSDAQKLSLPSFQLLSSGVRLTGLGTLGAGPDPQATRRVVQYERLLLDGAATGTAAGGSVSPTPLVMQKFAARHVQQLARNNALGREYLAAQPSTRAAQPVSWSEDTYAVVTTDTLDVRQDNFGSQLEAEQYRRAQANAADLLVMPTYQVALA